MPRRYHPPISTRQGTAESSLVLELYQSTSVIEHLSVSKSVIRTHLFRQNQMERDMGKRSLIFIQIQAFSVNPSLLAKPKQLMGWAIKLLPMEYHYSALWGFSSIFHITQWFVWLLTFLFPSYHWKPQLFSITSLHRIHQQTFQRRWLLYMIKYLATKHSYHFV